MLNRAYEARWEHLRVPSSWNLPGSNLLLAVALHTQMTMFPEHFITHSTYLAIEIATIRYCAEANKQELKIKNYKYQIPIRVVSVRIRFGKSTCYQIKFYLPLRQSLKQVVHTTIPAGDHCNRNSIIFEMTHNFRIVERHDGGDDFVIWLSVKYQRQS